MLCQHAPRDARTAGVTYRELPMPLDYQVITDSTPPSASLSQCLTMLLDAAVGIPDAGVLRAIYGTFTGAAAVLAGALMGIPVVVQTFGWDLMLGAAADDRYRRLMDLSYSRADLVIASDEELADALRRSYRGSRSPIRILPPGQNFAKVRGIARDTAVPARDRTRILAVQSSFNQAKGLGILLHAIALLGERLPHIELVVAGHDDTPGARIDGAMRELIRQLGISDRVTFMGHLEHEQVARTMAGCDVLVDPRVINSFSTCVYEAMTLGIPVVASDMPCNREALGGGSRGELVSNGDARDLARGITAVLDAPERTAELCRAATTYVAKAEQEFGSDVVAENLLAMYEQLTQTAG
ncbi:glycosyltransferase family 4 protein [Streptomyces sp. NPDC055109]